MTKLPLNVLTHLQENMILRPCYISQRLKQSRQSTLSQLWSHMLSNAASNVPISARPLHVGSIPVAFEKLKSRFINWSMTYCVIHHLSLSYIFHRIYRRCEAMVFFTCGHAFTMDDFVDSVLPELEKRISVSFFFGGGGGVEGWMHIILISWWCCYCCYCNDNYFSVSVKLITMIMQLISTL